MDQMTIHVRVDCPLLDEEGVTDLTRRLRAEIADSNVDDVQLVETTDMNSVGAKSSGAIAVGALIVTLAPVVVGSLMGVVSSWLNRQPRDVEIEIDNIKYKGPLNEAERKALVTRILSRFDSSS